MGSIIGAWGLESLVDLRDGTEHPRNYAIEGRLIYSLPSIVSVGMGYRKSTGYSSNFYTGEFRLDGQNKVFHHVVISSHESRNNTSLEREYYFSDKDTLVLTGKNIGGTKVKLVWKRLGL